MVQRKCDWVSPWKDPISAKKVVVPVISCDYSKSTAKALMKRAKRLSRGIELDTLYYAQAMAERSLKLGGNEFRANFDKVMSRVKSKLPDAWKLYWDRRASERRAL